MKPSQWGVNSLQMFGELSFTDYIVSEIKQRLEKELYVSSTVVNPNKYNLKIKFSRHIFAHFDCGRCGKSWSSSKATCQIQYSIKKGYYGEQSHVYFYVHVYRQKCLQCKSFSVARAGQSEMNWIVDCYIEKVNDIISGVKSVNAKGTKNNILLNGHKSSLCEACILGKCTQGDQGKSVNKSDQNSEMNSLLKILERTRI